MPRAQPQVRVVGPANFAQASDAAHDDNGPVVTIDHQVPHVSTVPANAGELVHLFLRERVRKHIGDGKPREAVLMIQERSVPVLAAAELRDDYDWALWLARSGGFDVVHAGFLRQVAASEDG